VTASQRWREQLEAWAIPEYLLSAVDESPYRWPVELFRRRNVTAREEEPPPTIEVVSRLAGKGGSVLDIGAGTGRASLPLAALGHPVTAVEKSSDMATALRQEAALVPGSYRVLEVEWPAEVDHADVVMAAHVVYDVADIDTFLQAMQDHARRAVVLELTESHPWTPLGPYYRALHGIDRPSGPTTDDLVSVIDELIGRRPEVMRWERPGGTWFESWDEIIELYGRRLVLPADRRSEVRPLLEPDVEEDGGRFTVGASVRRLATVWWLVDD
jgi:SAM-dependent methyltransferase